jgi:hypothetical protein
MSTKYILKADERVDPLKGPKGDTAFLKSNYKLMAVGGVFRTPKARFTHAQVHAGAKDAGWVVGIREEGPWLRVQVIGKAPHPTQVNKGLSVYLGAGKSY